MTRAPLILLTGAPGWLGTRLTECLLRGMPELESLHAPRADVVRCLALPGVNVDGPLGAEDRAIIGGQPPQAQVGATFQSRVALGTVLDHKAEVANTL